MKSNNLMLIGNATTKTNKFQFVHDKNTNQFYICRNLINLKKTSKELRKTQVIQRVVGNVVFYGANKHKLRALTFFPNIEHDIQESMGKLVDNNENRLNRYIKYTSQAVKSNLAELGSWVRILDSSEIDYMKHIFPPIGYKWHLVEKLVSDTETNKCFVIEKLIDNGENGVIIEITMMNNDIVEALQLVDINAIIKKLT